LNGPDCRDCLRLNGSFNQSKQERAKKYWLNYIRKEIFFKRFFIEARFLLKKDWVIGNR